MDELFVAFIQNPTPETYAAVRAFVVAHERYDGYSRDLDDMDDALRYQRYEDVRQAFGATMPNLLLSPSAHMLVSASLRDDGQPEAAEMERFICFCCITALQKTGDGTRERPYLVLRVSDEYDVMGALGKRLASQHLVQDGPRHYDRMVCDDGSELWFDITDMMDAQARRLQG